MRDDEIAATEVEGTAPTTDERVGPPVRSAPKLTGDRYRIVDKLGAGGMGEVLDAKDLQIGRDVAIKRMLGEAPSDRMVDRFLREARIQGRLEHPSIVPVHEMGRGLDGAPFFAMKKLTGTTLTKHIHAGTPLQRMLRAFTDVCLAVEFAHTRGFLHRDLKPDNIMLGDFGETYVLDWGVAKVLGAKDVELDAAESGEVVTNVGAIIGTPGYMPPEQARGDIDIDARVDVYALGSVLFEILAKQPLHPRGRDGLASALANIDCRPSARAPTTDIPPELDELVVKSTAFDREERIPTARALADAVQLFLDGDRDVARRRDLSMEHFAAAEKALASGDRGGATREAGRALVLDPTHRTCADFLSRLLLEPPKETPPEVKEIVEEESRAVVRRTAVAGLVGSLGYVVMAVLLYFFTGVPPAYAVAMIVLGGINAALLFAWTRSRTFYPKNEVFICSTMLCTLSCLVGSPYLVGPGIAALTALGVMAGAFLTRPHAVLVGGTVVAAVVVPFIGERAGWLPSTMHYENSKLVIDAQIFTGTAADDGLFIALTLLMVLTAIAFTRGIRTSERAAREQLHLLTWQLRHLVPSTS